MINAAPIANQPNPFTPATPEPVSPPPSVSNSAPPKSPMKKSLNLKLILGLVILLFVVVGSVAAYLLMQTSQDVRQQAATGYIQCCVENETVSTTQALCTKMGGKVGACPAPTCPTGTSPSGTVTQCAQKCESECVANSVGAKVCCPTGGGQQCGAGQVKLTTAQSCANARVYSYACKPEELEGNGACYKRQLNLGGRTLGSCLDLTARTIPGYDGCVWTQYDFATDSNVGSSQCGAWWASTCGVGGPSPSPRVSPTPPASASIPPSTPASTRPSPSTSPSTSPPVGPQCLSIKKNIENPAMGDNVVFTCGAVQGATRYLFRVVEPDGTVRAVKATGRVSAGFKITKQGRHFAQCRICYNSNTLNKEVCTPFESLQ